MKPPIKLQDGTITRQNQQNMKTNSATRTTETANFVVNLHSLILTSMKKMSYTHNIWRIINTHSHKTQHVRHHTMTDQNYRAMLGHSSQTEWKNACIYSAGILNTPFHCVLLFSKHHGIFLGRLFEI